jgi:hypothetical protein
MKMTTTFVRSECRHPLLYAHALRMWTDDSFPPAVALEDTKFDDVEWVPASKLAGDAPGVPDRMPLFWTIEPGDMRQGQLGDCWLIAAMSCLATFPEEIEDLFFGHSAEAAEDGRYTVMLYDHRSKRMTGVAIDEGVPCHRLGPRQYIPGWQHLRGGVPLFVKPNGETWPLLVEKAFAKLLGGYSALAGGNECAAFRALTGCTKQESWRRRGAGGDWRRSWLSEDDMHTFYHRVDDSVSGERMWAQIEEWARSSFLMAVSISGEGSGRERRRADGLVELHAYSLLMTMTIGDLRLLKLRNPWGSHVEWNGDWSDESGKWADHPNVAEALNFRAAADGLFWMSWDDFSQTFTEVEVSHKSMRTGPGRTRREHWQQAAAVAQPAELPVAIGVPAAPPPLFPARMPSVPPEEPPAVMRYRTDGSDVARAIAASLDDVSGAAGATAVDPPPLARMTTEDGWMAAAIAVSLAESRRVEVQAGGGFGAAADAGSGAGGVGAGGELICPLHGAECPQAPFHKARDLALHVSIACDRDS